MAKLKIYCGNYNGKQGRAVATTSQKKAAQLLGLTMNDMRNFFSGNGSPEHYKDCLDNPEIVYQYELSDYSFTRPLTRITR